MSLFETLKKAIFYNPMARADKKHPPVASTQPANTTRPAAAPQPSAVAAPETSATGAGAAAPRPAPPAPPASQEVDVEEILESLSANHPQKLNWRTSIVDLMKLVGLDSSPANRKQLATELGYTGDTGDSAAMNLWLHKAVMRKLAENGGKVPASLR